MKPRAGASNCYFDMLDKLHKSVCVTIGSRFTASLEPLYHSVNVASLTFLRYSFVLCSSVLAELVLFPYFHRRSTGSNRLHDFFFNLSKMF